MDADKKEMIKEPKGYTSVSTRLPAIEAVRFILHCKRLETNSSERIRDLIIKDMKNPSKQFLAGKNCLKYNKMNNSFSWFVRLDAGKESEVLSSISLEFLKNLQNEIQETIKERNDWVHQTKDDSVDVPGEIIGGENG